MIALIGEGRSSAVICAFAFVEAIAQE
jgi:hypothetical protein